MDVPASAGFVDSLELMLKLTLLGRVGAAVERQISVPHASAVWRGQRLGLNATHTPSNSRNHASQSHKCKVMLSVLCG